MAPYVGAPEIKARRLVLTVEYHGQIGNPGYYMIHATDHPEAPKLMRRAYVRAVDPIEPIEQLKLAWEAGTIERIDHVDPLIAL